MSKWDDRKDGAFVETDHDPAAANHEWYLTDQFVRRDTLGRRSSNPWVYRWLKVKCNGFRLNAKRTRWRECPAVGWVRADRIIALLPDVPEEADNE